MTPDRAGSDADRDELYGWMHLIVWFGSYRRRSAKAAGIMKADYSVYWDLGRPLPGNSCAEQTGGRKA